MNNYKNNNKKTSVVEDRVCAKYEIGFKSEEMEKVKLTQAFEEGATRTRKCPIFSGKEGAEGLIHVYKRFKKVAEYMQWNEGTELFGNFEMCLSSTAEENWSTLTEDVEEDDKTVEFFEEIFAQFLLKYCTSDARDLLIDYLKSPSCRKPHDADVREHSERIRTLCVLANSLPGTVPDLDEATKKKMLFDTFPEDWQLEFQKSRNYSTSSEQDIMDFMCIQKTTADKRENKRHFGGRGGGPPTQRGRFPGRGPGRAFGMQGRGFGGGRGFNGGGRNNFSGNYQRQQYFNSMGYNTNGNGYGNNNFGNNGNGGRFQNRFQNNNFQRGRVPSGRAPMGRGPSAASQHGNFMMQGRAPQDGRANGSSTHHQRQQNYFYDDYNEQQQHDDGTNWQPEYGFDNFYAEGDNYN